jgi:hypothetical protein
MARKNTEYAVNLNFKKKNAHCSIIYVAKKENKENVHKLKND